MPKSPLISWRMSPVLVRVIPFVLFVVLTACQGTAGESSRYWFYFGKTLLGALLLYMVYPWIREMRWTWSWPALLVGTGVFGLWVGLDGLYPSLDTLLRWILCPVLRPLGFEGWCQATAVPLTPWDPRTQFAGPTAWMFIITRLVGATLVVPPLEEVFYRSFLYRYLVKPEFDQVPLRCFKWVPLMVTSAIFGLAHHEWLAGIFCGLLYQGLVLRKGRLGEAMTAHAITNFLLGIWVIWKGAWHFW